MNARQKPARECCHNMKHDGMSCEEFDEIRPESVAATINPGDPPSWAVREADRIDRSYTMPSESANAAIARALAAAYARGREDAAKVDVGLLQRAADLAGRVAAGDSGISENEGMRVEQLLLHAIAAIRAGGA